MLTAKPIFSYRPYWAHRFGVAPVLPMSRAEMEQLTRIIAEQGYDVGKLQMVPQRWPESPTDRSLHP